MRIMTTLDRHLHQQQHDCRHLLSTGPMSIKILWEAGLSGDGKRELSKATDVLNNFLYGKFQIHTKEKE